MGCDSYPALVTDALRALATDTNTNDVGGGVEEALGELDEILVANLLDEVVDSHGVDQSAIANGGAVGQGNGLLGGVDLGDLTRLAEALLLGGKSVGDGDPDTTGTVPSGESESGIGSPVTGNLVQDDVPGDGLDIGGSNSLAEPLALHLRAGSVSKRTRTLLWTVSWARKSCTYLGGRNGPDLVVVRAHEDVGNANTSVSDDPLVKVLGLGVGNAVLKGSVDQTIQTSDLVLLGEHGDVVLEGVGDPKALVANVGDSLVDEPVVVLGESLVQAVVEVLVVGEDDVTANIVQLNKSSSCQRNNSNARFHDEGERE
jgi:hypothetical protein